MQSGTPLIQNKNQQHHPLKKMGCKNKTKNKTQNKMKTPVCLFPPLLPFQLGALSAHFGEGGRMAS
jgi:hypothetical protein